MNWRNILIVFSPGLITERTLVLETIIPSGRASEGLEDDLHHYETRLFAEKNMASRLHIDCGSPASLTAVFEAIGKCLTRGLSPAPHPRDPLVQHSSSSTRRMSLSSQKPPKVIHLDGCRYIRDDSHPGVKTHWARVSSQSLRVQPAASDSFPRANACSDSRDSEWVQALIVGNSELFEAVWDESNFI